MDASEEKAASWGLGRINQDGLPLDGRYSSGNYDGRGVHIYNLDTGVCGHPTLISKDVLKMEQQPLAGPPQMTTAMARMWQALLWGAAMVWPQVPLYILSR